MHLIRHEETFFYIGGKSCMLHINYGTGKGKTTAAMGLLLRQIGIHHKVVIAQFLKDGKSSEIAIMEGLGATCFHTIMPKRFYKDMEADEQRQLIRSCEQVFHEAIRSDCDCILFDELLDVIQLGLLDESQVIHALQKLREKELILTGRGFSKKVEEMADYVNEVTSHKHPYQKGIVARKGVEY